VNANALTVRWSHGDLGFPVRPAWRRGIQRLCYRTGIQDQSEQRDRRVRLSPLRPEHVSIT